MAVGSSLVLDARSSTLKIIFESYSVQRRPNPRFMAVGLFGKFRTLQTKVLPICGLFQINVNFPTGSMFDFLLLAKT